MKELYIQSEREIKKLKGLSADNPFFSFLFLYPRQLCSHCHIEVRASQASFSFADVVQVYKNKT